MIFMVERSESLGKKCSRCDSIHLITRSAGRHRRGILSTEHPPYTTISLNLVENSRPKVSRCRMGASFDLCHVVGSSRRSSAITSVGPAIDSYALLPPEPPSASSRHVIQTTFKVELSFIGGGFLGLTWPRTIAHVTRFA